MFIDYKVKFIMKKILISICLAGLVFSCKRVIEIEVPAIKGDPSGAIIDTRVISSNNGVYVFEADVHVVDDRGNYIRNLNNSSFTIRDTTIGGIQYSFKLLDLSKGLATPAKGDYSAALLLDQSGSILTTDPNDLRLEASKVFFNALGPNDNVALASFTANYYYDYKIHYGFTRKIESLKKTIDSLSYTVGGGTPLYYSMYEMVNYTSSKATHKNNKALVVFTDGDDTNGGASPEEIIDLAKEKDVQVFTVGLGSSISSLNVLADIADETGGSFMWAQDAKQLISFFGTLGNLLKGNASYYRVRWQVSTSRALSSKRNYLFYQQIRLPNGRVLRIPVSVKLP